MKLWLSVTLWASGICTLIESIFDFRQYRTLKSPNVPKSLEGLVDEKKYKILQKTALRDFRFQFVQSILGFLVEVLVLVTGVLPRIYAFSNDVLVNPVFESSPFHQP